MSMTKSGDKTDGHVDGQYNSVTEFQRSHNQTLETQLFSEYEYRVGF